MYGRWPKYVPVAQRRAKAKKAMQKLIKKGQKIEPIEIAGNKIARTFWGQAWCHHLEEFCDLENRLPKGRTYVRNGSVCHLSISKGKIEAMVSGSKIYKITISISPLANDKWQKIQNQCAGQIGSMLELLQGKFSDNVMKIVTDEKAGLFPSINEIKLDCDCPDWATMCKHIAAALYGVGARLDQQPELLFTLRKVDHEALISSELNLDTSSGKSKRRLASNDLSNLFGVEIAKPVKTPTKPKATTPTKINEPPVFSPTGKNVIKLRTRLRLNKSHFARLIGVSPGTLTAWEKNQGKLNLQQRSLEALQQANGLDWEVAKEKLALM